MARNNQDNKASVKGLIESIECATKAKTANYCRSSSTPAMPTLSPISENPKPVFAPSSASPAVSSSSLVGNGDGSIGGGSTGVGGSVCSTGAGAANNVNGSGIGAGVGTAAGAATARLKIRLSCSPRPLRWHSRCCASTTAAKFETRLFFLRPLYAGRTTASSDR